jgi:putative ABC transport system permease protein
MARMLRSLFSPWTWRMAWRESRSTRWRLIWFSLSISLGVAALAAVGSLAQTIRQAVEVQARTLLGADLVLTARQPFSPETEELFGRIGGTRARETSFSSMLVFPSLTNSTRLVNARAIEGAFPFYGRLETDPPEADAAMRRGEGLLIEQGVLYQFDLRVGDPVRLGRWTTRIAGALRRVPGDTVAFSTIAPRVYFDAARLPETELLGAASLARYREMFRFDPARDVEELVRVNKETFARQRLDSDTVERRKSDLGEALGNLNQFLNLVALVALLLGAIGIASAMQVHIQQKLPNAAVLRCLGAGMSPTFAVYLVQGLMVAAVGTALGLLAGAAVHGAIPRVVQSFVPFPIEAEFRWLPALIAALVGFLVSAAFTLLPMGSVRRVSPLAAIRADFEADRPRRDLWAVMVVGGLVCGLLALAIAGARRWQEGAAVVGGLAIVFLALAGTSRGLAWCARRFTPRGLPFAVRQGVANLHRPRNRTTLVLTAVGLGTFLLLTLQLTREVLLTQLFPVTREAQPNAILFDIQPDQHAGVIEVLGAQGLPVLDQAPIVTMRLASLKGRSTDDWLAEKPPRVPGWALRREYRSTWRTNLVSSEKLTAGDFVPRIESVEGAIPISFESNLARDLGLGLGDEVVFDVQGVLVTNRVASLREVDWRQVRPNFFVVFPAGALEAAPAMHVMATHVGDPGESARLQRTLVERFPNVSAIDLTLVLQTLDSVVAKVAFAIRFMALFTVLTGLVVLAGAILTGRWQRVREVVLLRTLGATRRDVRRTLLAEYATLGVLGAATGVVLAIGAAWALARFAFRAGFAVSPLTLVAAFGIVTVLTVIVGLATSRGIADEPPLEVLRREMN